MMDMHSTHRPAKENWKVKRCQFGSAEWFWPNIIAYELWLTKGIANPNILYFIG
jgi:hypothetical protein